MFQQAAFDIQKTMAKTKHENVQVLATVDVFFRFVPAKALPDERTDTIPRTLIEEWM